MRHQLKVKTYISDNVKNLNNLVTTNIQEEFQISKDFMKGHRTIHPT